MMLIALVHLDRADGDVLLHRFLQLELFVFQDCPVSGRGCASVFRRRVLGAGGGEIQRHALAQLIFGNRDSSFTVATMASESDLVGGGVDRACVIVLGFLHRGLAGIRIGVLRVRGRRVGGRRRVGGGDIRRRGRRGDGGLPGVGFDGSGFGGTERRERPAWAWTRILGQTSALAPASKAAPSIRVVAIRMRPV